MLAGHKCKAGIAISGPINYYIFHLNYFNYFTSSKFIPLNYLKFPSKFGIVSLITTLYFIEFHRVSLLYHFSQVYHFTSFVNCSF